MLTANEFQHRKECGFCYHCNEKFGPGHRCKKTLQMLIVQEDEDGVEELEDTDDGGGKAVDKEEPEAQLLFASVSLKSTLEWTSPKSFKLMGELQGKNITVLINSGATHNFLCASLGEEFQFQRDSLVHFKETLRNGKTNEGQDKFVGISYCLQGAPMSSNILLYQLGNIDMILGMEWLYSLG